MSLIWLVVVTTQIHTVIVLSKQLIIQFQPCIIGVVELKDLTARQ